MGDKFSPEWHTISAAKRIGISVEEYVSLRNGGQKWCGRCKVWHPISDFGIDATRGDGLASICMASKRVKIKKVPSATRKPRGWLVATRDGDKKQARRRINYLVEQGKIPPANDLPCIDCGDEVFLGEYRHEYDHARGYDGENQLYVEPVCSKCHHNREDARRGQAT